MSGLDFLLQIPATGEKSPLFSSVSRVLAVWQERNQDLLTLRIQFVDAVQEERLQVVSDWIPSSRPIFPVCGQFYRFQRAAAQLFQQRMAVVGKAMDPPVHITSFPVPLSPTRSTGMSAGRNLPDRCVQSFNGR